MSKHDPLAPSITVWVLLYGALAAAAGRLGRRRPRSRGPLSVTTRRRRARLNSPSKSRTQSAISSVSRCSTTSTSALGRTEARSTFSTCSQSIPFHLNDDWNLITRTILPIVWNLGSSIPTVPSSLLLSLSLRSSLPVTMQMGGSGAPARSCISDDQQRTSARASGALARAQQWSTRAARGSPACWSTTSFRSVERVGLQATVTAAFLPTLSLPTISTTGGISSAPNITANW